MASDARRLRSHRRTAGARTLEKASPGEPGAQRQAEPATAPEHIGGPREVILVGCGLVARQFYLPALRALEFAGSVTVRVVIDPLESSRTMFGRLFPKASVHASLDSVVAPPDTLVIIATAPRFHPAQAIAAFKRGWHVLCHTPIAPSAREAASMISAAQRHERLLSVALFKRFFPATRYLRTLCHDHLLGPLLSFSVHEGGPSSWPAAPLSIPERIEPPDGVLAEMGAHTLDLLIWWLGSPSVLRYADDAMGGVEANAFIELEFPEHVRGTVHLSRDWPTPHSYAFVFERGVVRWQADQGAQLTVQLASAPAALEARLVAPIHAVEPHGPSEGLATNAQSFVAQLQNVIAAIGGLTPLSVPASAAMQSLPIIEECYARRMLVEQPWLTRNEAAHARVLAPPAGSRRS